MASWGPSLFPLHHLFACMESQKIQVPMSQTLKSLILDVGEVEIGRIYNTFIGGGSIYLSGKMLASIMID